MNDLNALREKGDFAALFEALVMPVHEELYKRQDFSFIETLSPGQELLLRYDYVRMQVIQGGFIQLIQNGYIDLLPPMPAMLTQVGATEMAKILDDVLRVFSLNSETLGKETTVEEFAQLYEEFREFEELDAAFERLNAETEIALVDYALRFPDEFMEL
ncbi:hypothetical protein GCM10023092_12100 [Rurimicrobium arvi]|uniref:DNA mimic protein DMP19 C-terminal domain-containing protein n=1 Tax=Rurimicrobium arvi TaxID=2049916 RepID=A0ABP8MND4_9BACT